MSITQFAKLFETPDLGQLLVMKSDENDEPEICVYFTPADEMLGICSFAIGFPGTEERDKAFDSVDEAKAREGVESQIKFILGEF